MYLFFLMGVLKLFYHRNVIKNKSFIFNTTNILRTIKNYWLHVDYCICSGLKDNCQIRRWHCMGTAKGLTYNTDGCSVQWTLELLG